MGGEGEDEREGVGYVGCADGVLVEPASHASGVVEGLVDDVPCVDLAFVVSDFVCDVALEDGAGRVCIVSGWSLDE